jgi:hypothetical protein
MWFVKKQESQRSIRTVLLLEIFISLYFVTDTAVLRCVAFGKAYWRSLQNKVTAMVTIVCFFGDIHCKYLFYFRTDFEIVLIFFLNIYILVLLQSEAAMEVAIFVELWIRLTRILLVSFLYATQRSILKGKRPTQLSSKAGQEIDDTHNATVR